MKVKSIVIILSVIFLALNGFAQTENGSNELYFPHVDSDGNWETEICVINQGEEELIGTFELYNGNGALLSERPETIDGLGRRALIIGEEFSNPEDIRYIIFSTESSSICGYTTFYQNGLYRVAVPAVREINAGDVYIPHIDIRDNWWTGLALVNTTDSPKTLAIQFNTGETKEINMAPGEHWSNNIKKFFFDGVARDDIKSAVITGGSGVIGLELFSKGNTLSGVLLKNDMTDTLYFPHVASDETWWTGVVAYNPGGTETILTVTPYKESGSALTPTEVTIPAGGKYIGDMEKLALPATTAWFKINASQPVNGFELFGTRNGNQLAGYSVVNIKCKEGIFPKLEDDGWTGVAFVNTSDSEAEVKLTLYDNDGYPIINDPVTLSLAGHEKIVDRAIDFFGPDLDFATYIKFSSDSEVVGFQLNASADGMLLDALPASGQGATGHNAMLESLGVDTDLGARKDPVGNDVPADYNPTLRKNTQLRKQSEIFIAGIYGQNEPGFGGYYLQEDQNNGVLDWPHGGEKFREPVEPVGVDAEWLNLRKAAAAGDLDGDGVDEIIVAYLNKNNDLLFKVIEKTNSGYEVDEPIAIKEDNDISQHYESTNYALWWVNFNAVCGDVDGNGEDETLIAFNGSIFLIGDSSKGYQPLGTEPFDLGSDADYIILRISAGDLDNNGTDEFVVVENRIWPDKGKAIYHIYSGADLAYVTGGNVETYSDTFFSANCAVGDLDADGLNEILFVGTPPKRVVGETYWMYAVEQEWDEDGNTGKFVRKTEIEEIEDQGDDGFFLIPSCAIADFDGDGKKEIIGYRRMYENLSETGGNFEKVAMYRDNGAPVYDICNPEDNVEHGNSYDYSLTVGDYDGDGKADIAYMTDYEDWMRFQGFDSAGDWKHKAAVNLDGTLGDSFSEYPPVLISGDFDGNDSLVVEFQGSELLFSDPHPIAVLAAAPSCAAGDVGGDTWISVWEGSEEEYEDRMGFEVGASVGYETEVSFFGLGKTGTKLTAYFESSFDWTASHSTSHEQVKTLTTHGQDMVLFTAIPYDVYYYKVISASDEVDDVDVGETIIVNLPRRPVKTHAELSYYNACVGTGKAIELPHTVGDPLSYPSREKADELIAAGGGDGVISSENNVIGQGKAGFTTEISLSKANAHGTNFDLSVGIESEISAGGAIIGASAGFHYGESYSIRTYNGTAYGGAIDSNFDELFSEESFEWGLFTYGATFGNESCVVVEYYVVK